MFSLFDIWHLTFLERTIAQVTSTPLVKVLTANSESVLSSVVTPCDAPYTATSDNERLRHATFLVPTSGGGSGGEGGGVLVQMLLGA